MQRSFLEIDGDLGAVRHSLVGPATAEIPIGECFAVQNHQTAAGTHLGIAVRQDDADDSREIVPTGVDMLPQ